MFVQSASSDLFLCLLTGLFVPSSDKRVPSYVWSHFPTSQKIHIKSHQQITQKLQIRSISLKPMQKIKTHTHKETAKFTWADFILKLVRSLDEFNRLLMSLSSFPVRMMMIISREWNGR